MQSEYLLSLRIELVDSPPGHAFCLQRGKASKSEQLDYVESVGDLIAFDLSVTVRKANSGPEPDFFGPFVQGPPGQRFFYLCAGHVVEGDNPRWFGRVKVPLRGIDWAAVQSAAEAAGLAARYQASRPDGRAALATVGLMGEGWVAGA